MVDPFRCLMNSRVGSMDSIEANMHNNVGARIEKCKLEFEDTASESRKVRVDCSQIRNHYPR